MIFIVVVIREGRETPVFVTQDRWEAETVNDALQREENVKSKIIAVSSRIVLSEHNEGLRGVIENVLHLSSNNIWYRL